MGRSSSSLSVPVMLRQNNAGVGYFFHDYEIIIISWLYFYMTCPWGKKAWKRDPSPAPKKFRIEWLLLLLLWRNLCVLTRFCLFTYLTSVSVESILRPILLGFFFVKSMWFKKIIHNLFNKVVETKNSSKYINAYRIGTQKHSGFVCMNGMKWLFAYLKIF